MHELRKTNIIAFFCLILVALIANISGMVNTGFAQLDDVEGWAAILEMGDYPDPYTDMITDYSDTKKWNNTLHKLGWKSENMFIVNGLINRSDVENGVNFLINSTDENDIGLFFIFAHYTWIINETDWKDWFAILWRDVPCQKKLLMVSACKAEDLINPVKSDPNSHISIACAQEDELAWAGIEEEGLPIIGEVMNHYLTGAFLKRKADSNKNEDVSVEEAFQYCYGQTRKYYTDVVFPAFPGYVGAFNGEAPHPVIDDAYTGEMSLRLEGAVPLENDGIPIWLMVVPIGIIGGILVVVAILIIRKRRK